MPDPLVSVVTGGSRGIGAATVARLAARGDRVHLLYRADTAAAEAVAGATGARAWQCDVGDEAAVTATVAAIADAAGGIDVLVNNAGTTADALLAASTLDQWHRTVTTNLTGTFLMCRAVLPHLLAQRSGAIVNVSSSSAHRAGPGQVAYAASKGGVEALTRALAAEVAHKGIRVNAVSPGRVRTDMTAPVADRLGGGSGGARALAWGQPEQVAEVIAFLGGPESGYVNGQVLLADGGLGVRRA